MFVQTFSLATRLCFFTDLTPAAVRTTRVVTVVISVLPLLKGWLSSCMVTRNYSKSINNNAGVLLVWYACL